MPAYQSIAQTLRDLIDDGEIEVGQRLPSETALAERFGVSRPTIREALRSLQESGFVERASPRIMKVRGHDEEPAQRQIVRSLRRSKVTFADLLETLELLEPALSRQAAERATADEIRELEQNLAAQERNLANFAAWNRLDQDFHLTIAEIAGNPALKLAREPITRLLMPSLDQLMSSESLTKAALGRHRRILAEIAAGEGEAAELMTRRHIQEFEEAWADAGLDLRGVVEDRSQAEAG
ncbi:MAG: FadR family transcriptional regulator [Actinobacteria bacterium]|nr:FadR family transcriptional regulator [Actinomycetota bacterium]